MKIRCEVLSVSTDGECLEVFMEGKPPSSAFWRPSVGQKLKIPDTEANRRNYYVGRIVMLTATLP